MTTTMDEVSDCVVGDVLVQSGRRWRVVASKETTNAPGYWTVEAELDDAAELGPCFIEGREVGTHMTTSRPAASVINVHVP